MDHTAIICVDDERSILDSLKKELQEGLGYDYLVEIAENGKDAVKIYDELIMNGYKIPLVIADYIMPNIKGDELLKIIHNKNNRTYTIMLTGQADLNGISNAVNFANLYRLITKPWNYDELLFTVREALNNYHKSEIIEKQHNFIQKNKKLFEEVKGFKDLMNLSIEEKNELFNNIIPELIELTNVFEHGFFVGPTKFIIKLSLILADRLQLQFENRASLVISILLLHKINQNVPERFVGTDPCSLDINDVKEFFKKYNSEIDNLSKNIYLNKYAIILSLLWEHHDGTGLPKKLGEKYLNIVSQILNLAVNFHSALYKFSDEDIEILKEENEVAQTPEKTEQRHISAMKEFFKNSSWYDPDLVETFKRLMNSKQARELFVERDLIKVYIHEDDIKIVKFKSDDYFIDKEQKLIIPIEKILKDQKKADKDAKEKSKAESKRSLVTMVEFKDIRPGMITGHDIYTKFGRMVIPRDTLLSEEDLDELKKAQRLGLLKDNVQYKVFVPREV